MFPLLNSKGEQQPLAPLHECVIAKKEIDNNFTAILFREKLASTLQKISPLVKNPKLTLKNHSIFK